MTTACAFRMTAGLVTVLLCAQPATAQIRSLTLAEVLQLATDGSESLEVARAGESRADAEQQRALSLKLPQVSFSGAYQRTLASEFSSAFESSAPPCPALNVDSTLPVADRIAELERAATCGSLAGGGLDFSTLPFGQRNIYQLSFGFSQALYTGGRISAAERQATLSRQVASLTTSAAEAVVALEATQAFYDAALSDRLLAIAEAGLAQATAAYEQTRLAFDAGQQPEFELLRAQVARDNQQPVVLRRRADRDIAYLRLRQLLDLPADVPIELVVDLDAPELPPPSPFAEPLARRAELDPATERASVRQARALVDLREAGVTLARAERMPTISLTSTLNPVGYPADGVFPGFDDFRTNWSLAASVQVPLFSGGRLRAGELAARADLAEARAQLRRAGELAVLDAATAEQDLLAAEAVWRATAGTIAQAERAYEIAELRSREGLSTQLELNDSRLSLQIALANRAQAARDLQIARARVALLPGLPVATP